MIEIRRHYTDNIKEIGFYKKVVNNNLKKYNSGALRILEDDESVPRQGTLGVYSLDYFNEYQLVPDTDKDQQQMQDLLGYTLKFACSYYNKAYHPDQLVKVQYGEKVLEQRGAENPNYMDYDSWLKFFYLFMVTRSKTGINLFKGITREQLMDSNILFTDEPDFCMVEFMQSLVRDDINTKEAWQKAWDAIQDFADNNHDPEKVLIKERMLMLEAPTLLLYQALSSGNSDAFNEQLEETLNYHKDYWNRTDCTGSTIYNDKNGWISWRILACCSIAHDSGLEIRIKSDYLPQWLYKGEVKDWGLKF